VTGLGSVRWVGRARGTAPRRVLLPAGADVRDRTDNAPRLSTGAPGSSSGSGPLRGFEGAGQIDPELEATVSADNFLAGRQGPGLR